MAGTTDKRRAVRNTPAPTGVGTPASPSPSPSRHFHVEHWLRGEPHSQVVLDAAASFEVARGFLDARLRADLHDSERRRDWIDVEAVVVLRAARELLAAASETSGPAASEGGACAFALRLRREAFFIRACDWQQCPDATRRWFPKTHEPHWHAGYRDAGSRTMVVGRPVASFAEARAILLEAMTGVVQAADGDIDASKAEPRVADSSVRGAVETVAESTGPVVTVGMPSREWWVRPCSWLGCLADAAEEDVPTSPWRRLR